MDYSAIIELLRDGSSSDLYDRKITALALVVSENKNGFRLSDMGYVRDILVEVFKMLEHTGNTFVSPLCDIIYLFSKPYRRAYASEEFLVSIRINLCDILRILCSATSWPNSDVQVASITSLLAFVQAEDFDSDAEVVNSKLSSWSFHQQLLRSSKCLEALSLVIQEALSHYFALVDVSYVEASNIYRGITKELPEALIHGNEFLSKFKSVRLRSPRILLMLLEIMRECSEDEENAIILCRLGVPHLCLDVLSKLDSLREPVMYVIVDILWNLLEISIERASAVVKGAYGDAAISLTELLDKHRGSNAAAMLGTVSSLSTLCGALMFATKHASSKQERELRNSILVLVYLLTHRSEARAMYVETGLLSFIIDILSRDVVDSIDSEFRRFALWTVGRLCEGSKDDVVLLKLLENGIPEISEENIDDYRLLEQSDLCGNVTNDSNYMYSSSVENDDEVDELPLNAPIPKESARIPLFLQLLFSLLNSPTVFGVALDVQILQLISLHASNWMSSYPVTAAKVLGNHFMRAANAVPFDAVSVLWSARALASLLRQGRDATAEISRTFSTIAMSFGPCAPQKSEIALDYHPSPLHTTSAVIFVRCLRVAGVFEAAVHLLKLVELSQSGELLVDAVEPAHPGSSVNANGGTSLDHFASTHPLNASIRSTGSALVGEASSATKKRMDGSKAPFLGIPMATASAGYTNINLYNTRVQGLGQSQGHEPSVPEFSHLSVLQDGAVTRVGNLASAEAAANAVPLPVLEFSIMTFISEALRVLRIPSTSGSPLGSPAASTAPPSPSLPPTHSFRVDVTAPAATTEQLHEPRPSPDQPSLSLLGSSDSSPEYSKSQLHLDSFRVAINELSPDVAVALDSNINNPAFQFEYPPSNASNNSFVGSKNPSLKAPYLKVARDALSVGSPSWSQHYRQLARSPEMQSLQDLLRKRGAVSIAIRQLRAHVRNCQPLQLDPTTVALVTAKVTLISSLCSGNVGSLARLYASGGLSTLLDLLCVCPPGLGGVVATSICDVTVGPLGHSVLRNWRSRGASYHALHKQQTQYWYNHTNVESRNGSVVLEKGEDQTEQKSRGPHINDYISSLSSSHKEHDNLASLCVYLWCLEKRRLGVLDENGILVENDRPLDGCDSYSRRKALFSTLHSAEAALIRGVVDAQDVLEAEKEGSKGSGQSAAFDRLRSALNSAKLWAHVRASAPFGPLTQAALSSDSRGKLFALMSSAAGRFRRGSFQERMESLFPVEESSDSLLSASGPRAVAHRARLVAAAADVVSFPDQLRVTLVADLLDRIQSRGVMPDEPDTSITLPFDVQHGLLLHPQREIVNGNRKEGNNHLSSTLTDMKDEEMCQGSDESQPPDSDHDTFDDELDNVDLDIDGNVVHDKHSINNRLSTVESDSFAAPIDIPNMHKGLSRADNPSSLNEAYENMETDNGPPTSESIPDSAYPLIRDSVRDKHAEAVLDLVRQRQAHLLNIALSVDAGEWEQSLLSLRTQQAAEESTYRYEEMERRRPWVAATKKWSGLTLDERKEAAALKRKIEEGRAEIILGLDYSGNISIDNTGSVNRSAVANDSATINVNDDGDYK